MDTPAFEAVGTGPTVLLLHSFPMDRSMWSALAPELAEAGYTAVAVDLPGFGATPVPAHDGPPTLQTYVDAALAVLDARGDRTAVVLGLSLGGYVALGFAREHLHRLRGLVLADTRAAADAPLVKTGRVMNMNLVQKQGPGALMDKLLPGLVAKDAPESVRAPVRAMAARQPVPGVSYALLAMRDRADVTADLPSLRTPALVLCGAHDAVTPPAEMRSMAEAMPDARFIELAHAGHLSNLEQPAAFRDAVLSFLRGLPEA